MSTSIKALREHIKRLELAGIPMSNTLYNWKQDQKRFTAHERKLMDEMVRQWDAAVRREP